MALFLGGVRGQKSRTSSVPECSTEILSLICIPLPPLLLFAVRSHFVCRKGEQDASPLLLPVSRDAYEYEKKLSPLHPVPLSTHTSTECASTTQKPFGGGSPVEEEDGMEMGNGIVKRGGRGPLLPPLPFECYAQYYYTGGLVPFSRPLDSIRQ